MKIEDTLTYDLNTGLLWWKTLQNYNQSFDKPAGYSHYLNKYIIIGFNRKYYRAHRIAWYLTYGYWPKEIDHINGIRTDNRLANLREVSRSENLENHTDTPNKKSHSSLRGAFYETNTGRYRSKLCVNKELIDLGRFSTALEAHEAYRNAKLQYHKYNERFL